MNTSEAAKEKIDVSPLPGWWSEAETEAALHCKATKLWQLRQAKKLIWSRIGGRVYYQVASILKLLERNATNVDE